MQADLIWAGGLFVGLLIAALLVNRLAPERRKSVRRIAILYVLYLLAFGLRYTFVGLQSAVWAERLLVASELLQAFVLVNVVGTLAFAVLLRRVGINLPMIASDIIVGLGYVAATIAVLAGHGLNPSSVLATSAVVSAVLAFSLQSTLGNIFGGVALQLDGSVHEGDWVQLENGKQGKVRAIRWRHTVVETRDWSTIIVPNAQLLAGNIMILGRRGGEDVPQRMWVWFAIDFRFSPDRVIKVVTEALNASPIPGVSDNPPPNVVCMDFMRVRNESVASYAARYWLTDLPADDPTNSRVRARIYAALKREGIPLAVPAQTNFVEMQDEGRLERRKSRRLAERVAALRTVQLFRSLTNEEIETLADGMGHVIYTGGEVITRQGARANWLYIMTRGSAEVRTTYDPDGEGPIPAANKLVATLTAPNFFGEMGLMLGEPRQADIVAVTDVECFRLGTEAFERVLLARPAIVDELSDRMASRHMELIAVREDLDAAARQSRHDKERDQILTGIKSFFGL